MLYFGGKSETKSYLRTALSPPLPVTGELLFRPFFLRIPTQGNNVTLGRKRLNRVFGRHNESMAPPGILLEGRASRNRVCSIVSGGFFRRSFSALGCVLIVRFFCGGFFFTMIRYDTTFFMGIQSSPRRVATQYQDPMWPRRHTHRSPLFVEIFGHWWHSQRHASNQAITLANSGWIPAR